METIQSPSNPAWPARLKGLEMMLTKVDGSQIFDELLALETAWHHAGEEPEDFTRDAIRDALDRLRAMVPGNPILVEGISTSDSRLLSDYVTMLWNTLGFAQCTEPRMLCPSQDEFTTLQNLKSRFAPNVSKPSPSPAADNEKQDDMPGWKSCSDLAKKHNLSDDSLRKRLQRWRKLHDDGWMEVNSAERKSREAQFLYRESAVSDIIQSLKAK